MKIASRPDDRIVISWDIALSEIESGDYSACVVLLIRKEIVYILEVVRGRFPFETLKKKVMELKRRYNPSTLLIDDSPISLGLIQSLREQSITVTNYKPETIRLRTNQGSQGRRPPGWGARERPPDLAVPFSGRLDWLMAREERTHDARSQPKRATYLCDGRVERGSATLVRPDLWSGRSATGPIRSMHEQTAMY